MAMRTNDQKRAERMIRKKGARRRWMGVVAVLAVGVIVATTYMLLRPAIATNRENAENLIGMNFTDENGNIIEGLTADSVLSEAPDYYFVNDDDVTDLIIERKDAEGALTQIAEDEIQPGDELRVTVTYAMSQLDMLAGSIAYKLPEQYGEIVTAQGDLTNGVIFDYDEFDQAVYERTYGRFYIDDKGLVNINYSADTQKDIVVAMLQERYDEMPREELLAEEELGATKPDDLAEGEALEGDSELLGYEAQHSTGLDDEEDGDELKTDADEELTTDGDETTEDTLSDEDVTSDDSDAVTNEDADVESAIEPAIKEETTEEASEETTAEPVEETTIEEEPAAGEGSAEDEGLSARLGRAWDSITAGLQKNMVPATVYAAAADETVYITFTLDTKVLDPDVENYEEELAALTETRDAEAALAAEQIEAEAEVTGSLAEVEEEAKEKIEQVKEAVKTADDLDIPASVDLAQYITGKTIYRREEDGSYTEISESEIQPGDHLRIDWHYSMPEEAALSDDIHFELPEEYGNAVSKTDDLDNGSGSYEVASDGQITIRHSADKKLELLEELGVSVGTTDDSYEGETETTAADDEETVEEIEEIEDTGDIEETGEAVEPQARIEAVMPVAALGNARLFAFGTSFTARPTDVMLAEENTVQTDSVVPGGYDPTKEFILKSAELRRNPETESKWINGQEEVTPKSLDSGTLVTEGDQVKSGDMLLFNMKFQLPKQSISGGDEEKRTITYTLDPSIPIYTSLSGESIYNYSNQKVGTFAVDKDTHVVTFVFDDEFADGNGTMTIDGNFYILAKIESNGNDQSESKHYDLGAVGGINIVVIDDSKTDLSVEKTETAYNEETGVISYKVVVSTNQGSNGNITLEDQMNLNTDGGAGIVVGHGSDKDISLVKIDKDGNRTTYGAAVDGDGWTRTWSLNALAARESYELTYSFPIPKEGRTGAKAHTMINTAIAKDKTNDQRSSVSRKFDGDGTTVTNDGDPNIEKWHGGPWQDGKQYSYQIRLNSKKANLKGYTLKDLLSRVNGETGEIYETDYPGTLLVEYTIPDDGLGMLKAGQNVDVRGDGFTFTEDDYHTYSFYYTYNYSANDLIWGGTLRNTARITKEDKKIEATHDIWVGDDKVRPNFDKQATDIGSTISAQNTVDITWQVSFGATIKRNEGTNASEYWVYRDKIGTTGASQVITSAQLEELRSAVAAAFDSSAQVITTGSGSAGEVSGFTGFEIRVYSDLTSDKTITYHTTGYVGDGGKDTTFYNKGWVYKDSFTKNDEITFEGDAPTVTKTDGNGNGGDTEHDYYSNTLYQQGILSWKMNVTIPTRFAGGTLSVIDTLPEGAKLLTDGTYNDVQLYGLSVADNDSMNGAAVFQGGTASFSGTTFTETVNGNTITTTFDASAFKGKTLTFLIHASTSDYFTDKVTKGEFENTVTLKQNDKDYGSDKQKQTVTKVDNAMSKFSTKLYDDEGNGVVNTYEYTIDVNPSAADLLPNSDTLVLKDAMHSTRSNFDFQVRLVPGSVNVYEVNGNNEIVRTLSDSEYSCSSSGYDTGENNPYAYYNNLEFRLPDKKHLRVTYRYVFEEDTPASYQSDVTAINSAKLEGDDDESNLAEDKTTVRVLNVKSRADMSGINLFKVDSGNMNKFLDGAYFTLYRWDTASKSWVENTGSWDPAKKVWLDSGNEYGSEFVSETTDDGRKGLAAVQGCTYNVAYKLVETKSPSGYVISEEPFYFMLVAEDKDHYPVQKPEVGEDPEGGIYTIKEMAPAESYYFKNTSENTEITVTKTWVNEDSTKPASIDVKIGRRVGAIATSSAGRYWTVHVIRQDGNGNTKRYVGYPSVADGSVLTYTAGGYKTNWQSLPTVTVNGTNIDVSSLFNESGNQTITLTETINGDTTVIVRDNWQYQDWNMETSISSASVGAVDENGEEVPKVDEPDYRTITLTEVDGWSMTLNDLERTYHSEEKNKDYQWLYYVSEVNNIYYTSSYSSNNSAGIPSGELTITNTRDETVQPYVLPKTGSMGTTPFLAGGGLMAGLGALGMTGVLAGRSPRSRRRRTFRLPRHRKEESK